MAIIYWVQISCSRSFLTKPIKNCVSRQESIFSHRCPQLRMVWLTCEGDTQVQSLHLFLNLLGKSPPPKRLGRCPKKCFLFSSLYKSLLVFESLIIKSWKSQADKEWLGDVHYKPWQVWPSILWMKNVSLFCPEFGYKSFFRASLVIITRTTTKTTICLHLFGCSSGTSSQEWLFRSGTLQTTIEKQKTLAPGKKSEQICVKLLRSSVKTPKIDSCPEN